MVRIEDGLGKTGNVRVSTNQRLNVSARAAPRNFYVSRDDGQVYTVISEDGSAVANEETIYLQNISSTKNLFIDNIIISPDTASSWRIKFVTGTAAGGSVLTAVNLNKTSSNAADVTARGDGSITGLTDDGDLGIIRVGANDTGKLNLEAALILGQNDAIAVECETNSAVEITIEFHLE